MTMPVQTTDRYIDFTENIIDSAREIERLIYVRKKLISITMLHTVGF